MSELNLEFINNAIAAIFREMQRRGVVLTGTDDPRGDGLDPETALFAPVGAEYVQTALGIQVKRFQKFGPTNFDWAETLSAGGGGTVDPLVVDDDISVAASWYQRTVHVTATAEITLSTTLYEPPDGFVFIAIIETNTPVTLIKEGGGTIRTILGAISVVGYSYQYAMIAFTFRAGQWYAVGQLTDETP